MIIGLGIFLWMLMALVTTFWCLHEDSDAGIKIEFDASEVIIMPLILTIFWWVLFLLLIAMKHDQLSDYRAN